MNEINENILQAIETIANDIAAKLQYDKTIKAKIYSIVNLDTGEYKVRYDGNIFSAYCDDKSKTYKVDDWVYVMVPQGDFSERKLITSLVSAQSLTEGQLNSLQNTVIPVSPSFLDMYQGVADPPYGVIAGIVPGEQGSEFYIYRGSSEYNPNDFHGLFQQYGSKYETIRISGEFSTKFHCVHNQGNYGIEVGFYAKDGSTVTYKLDLNSFLGDPYSLTVYSPQSAVIRVPKSFLLGLSYIKLFEENFIPDHLIENGVVTDKENLTVANIFVRNVSLEFVEVKDLTDASYYLNISALQGIAFSSNISTIDLVGRLIYQGKDIMDDRTCACRWFQRDLSVMIGDDRYDKNAGFAWAPIDNRTSRMQVTTAEVPHQQEYKLLVTYNNTVQLSAEITLYNHLSTYSFELEQVTNDADILLRITDPALVGEWYVSYPDGSYVKISGDERTNAVAMNEYLQYYSVQFYCAVYDGDTYLGVLQHTMAGSASEDDLTIQYVGEDTFRYDANGGVGMTDAEKERTLQVNLTWREGVGTSYIVHWVMRDMDNREVEIPTRKEDGYNPPNSMMQGLWVDNYNILHYNIKQKYKINYNNNTLAVKIETISGDIYTFNKEILFLKDGDQGTNGTTYVAAIRPCDDSGNKLSGLHPLVYNGNWGPALPLRCYVYKDGELINNDPEHYQLTFTWSGINVSIDGTESQIAVQGTPTITADSPTIDLQFYVKVAVRIVDATKKDVYIYTTYPIDVAVGGIDYTKINIDDIPSYIKYTSSGQTPQFYSNNLNYYYDDESYNELIESLNTNLLNIRDDSDGNRYLEPASSFIFEDIKSKEDSQIAVLSLRDPTSEERELIHPIVMYLDTYGNEAINGWDGTAIIVDEGEDQYVFAPQVGAGEKDSANRFSGVVMGKDSVQDQIGLYGYQHGVNTFGLMADGTAFFGAKSGGGQIIINGKTATISGGGGGNSAVGMTITLADLSPGSKTSAIKLGAGAFEVLYDGSVTATAANIQGKIYAQEGQIGCDSNKRGGWTIVTNRLSSGSGNRTVALDSSEDWYAIWAGKSSAGTAYNSGATEGKITNPAPFVVTKDGFLYAYNAEIRGQITATGGKIGGWSITSNTLQSSRGGTDGIVGMASTGQAAFWVGQGITSSTGSISENDSVDRNNSYYFLVTRDGKLYCKAAEIRGRITATDGKIGGWSIEQNGLYNDDRSVYLTPYSFTFGDSFSVSRSGVNVEGNITANSGKIGSWSISNGSLSSGNTTLSSNGQITTSQLNATGGSIGGWTIRSGWLQAGNTILSSIVGVYTNSITVSTGVPAVDASGRPIGGDTAGTIGYERGSSGNAIALESNQGLILTASGNARLGGSDTYLEGGTIYVGNFRSTDEVQINGTSVHFNASEILINRTDLDTYIENVVRPMIPTGG